MVNWVTSTGEGLGDAEAERSRVEDDQGIYSKDADVYDAGVYHDGAAKTLEDDNETDKPQLTTDQLEQLASRRALRTSSWFNTFFLLTTDIMGPSVAPWAFSYLGYIPGFIIFFFLGMTATYTGFILLNLFLKLDNEVHPIRTFSDIAALTLGEWSRLAIAFLQSLQLILSVAVLILGEAQTLQDMLPSMTSVCFLVLTAGWTLFGMTVGFIKVFSHLSQFANWCIWINISICIVCMALGNNPRTAHYDWCNGVLWDNNGNWYSLTFGIENLPANFPFGPVNPVISVSGGAALLTGAGGGNQTSCAPFDFANVAEAVMNIVYAYGGASMFVELMSEMKNARDFWKSLLCCEAIIIGVYMTFGLVFYAQQGQYVSVYPQFGIHNRIARLYCNGIGEFTGIIAACMYGNTGMKVFYFTIVEDLLHGPKLGTKWGTFLWIFIVIFTWWVAFLIASGIPSINGLVGIVGALCIMAFSYTFPPIMQFVYYNRQDGWNLRKLWWLKTLDMTIFLGSLAAMGIGLWGSGTSMAASVAGGGTNSLSCAG